ncbi:MAG: hypothetical protein AAGE43_19525 [Pseudomonadota bacterium]
MTDRQTGLHADDINLAAVMLEVQRERNQWTRWGIGIAIALASLALGIASV